MANVFNKFCSLASQRCPSAAADDNKEWPKIRFLPLLLDPFRLFIDSFGSFLGLAFLFGGLMALISCLTGFPVICSLKSGDEAFYCSSSLGFYALGLLLKLLLGVLFMVSWQWRMSEKKLSWREVFRPGKKFAVTLLTVLGFLGLFVFPLVSFFYLAGRVPNPDWRVEVAVFAFFFFLFIIPLFGMRMLPLLSAAAEGDAGLGWREIWRKTSGANLKILIVLFIMLLLFVYLSGSLLGGYAGAEIAHPLYVAFSSEFIYDFLILMAVAWIMGLSYSLKLFLRGENCHE